MKPLLIVVAVLLVVTIVVVAMNLWMRGQGYAVPGRAAVRCSEGHLFRVLWIEGGSLKAIRMGPRTRYLRCPVGAHWSVVHPVKESDLTPAERSELDGRSASG